MSSKGTLIVIEGSDGSGKTTQVELLASRLRKAGHVVETISFPQYDEPSSYFIREYLSGRYGKAAHVNPYAASLFYALDRFQAATAIREALEKGVVVLANRYVGSNMAHQGAKFPLADERRGFFVWLDSIEYQTLGLPRPSTSFVLHVPNDIAEQLINKRGRQKDEHEQDSEGLAAATQAYIELCDLFPNDFVRMDCVRGGKLLSEETIHAMVWAAVEPILPAPTRLPTITATATPPKPKKATNQAAKANRAHAATSSTNIEASLLLAVKLGTVPVLPAAPEFYMPQTLEGDIQREYRHALAEILQLRQEIVQAVAKYLQTPVSRHKALESGNTALAVADLVLPYATLVPIALDKLSSGVHIDIAEAKHLEITHDNTAAQSLTALAQKYLPQNHTIVTPEPKLVSFWPRNELELLPEMLYGYANIPQETIRNAVDAWPIQRKQDALIRCIQANGNKAVLGSYRYIWDITADFPTFQELSNRHARITGQRLTPRYGYAIPPVIDEAMVTDQFIRCFEISLNLYEHLQAAGLAQEAQYAVLLGHKQRYAVATTAKHSLAESANPVITAMSEKLLEVHPILHETKAINELESKEP